jgi:predicted RNA-binding Zn-ribbon protein involved in translation (DUF1610 family)
VKQAKPTIHCASCARRLARGLYTRCPLGCGAALCKRRYGCGNAHVPYNCPSYQAPRGLTEAPHDH